MMKTHFERMAGGVAAMRECDECSTRAVQGLQVLMTPMPALCSVDEVPWRNWIVGKNRRNGMLLSNFRI